MSAMNASQTRSVASSVIYANRHYLEIYRMYHPERLATKNEGDGPTIVSPSKGRPSAVMTVFA